MVPNGQRIPYIISIAGSVAVGKSTTARVLQALLSRWPEHRRVELITTDGFLHPNQVLKERGLMKKKGFPESYDMHRLVKFVSDLKSGVPNVTAPVYSHLIYDVIPDGDKTVVQPDILILEGLNVLQSGMDYPHDPHHVFVSDFVDFSIYVDAPEDLLQTWYINRFLKFREGAFTDPDSYFHNYAKLTKEEAIKTAMTLWKEINWLNLKQNILPTRERASLILTKSANHAVERSDYANNLPGERITPPFLFFCTTQGYFTAHPGLLLFHPAQVIKPPVCLFRVKCQIFLYHQ